MKWTSEIWIEHCKEQDEAFLAELKKVNDLCLRRLPWKTRVAVKLVDLLDWMARWVFWVFRL